MTDSIVLDTRITEPSWTAGEQEMLLFSLERSRAQFAWKAGSLDAAGLAFRLPGVSITLGGLLKHLALVEDMKAAEFFGPGPIEGPWRRVDFDTDPEWDWHSAADDSPEYLYAQWQESVARGRAAIDRALAERGLDGLSWFDAGDWHPNLRRPLVDLCDEYARHVGHADLLREAFDGLVGEDPPQS